MNRRRRVGITGHGTGGEAAVALELYMEMKSIPPPPAADDRLGEIVSDVVNRMKY